MKNFKLTIQYDGSRYKGYKNQKDNDLTIQGKLEAVLSKMAEEKVIVIGSEHTDVGVHAENYVANFKTNCAFSAGMMLDYLYEYLPEDIVVKTLEEVEERFHAKYNVKSKTYVYTVNNNAKRDVFTRKYTYHVEESLDITSMKEASQYLVGTHDFQSFTSLKSDSKSTIRTIEHIVTTVEAGVVKIEIKANDFLWNMPRMIIGALIEVGQGDMKPQAVKTRLEQETKPTHAPMAKAKALSLVEVAY